MPDYMLLGYRSEEEFLEEYLGCTDEYTSRTSSIHMTQSNVQKLHMRDPSDSRICNLI